MQKDIILELASCALDYMDKVPVNGNPNYKNCSEKYDKLLERLNENLSDEERRKVLFDLDLEQCGMFLAYAEEYFKAGFKLGLNLAFQNILD